MELKKGCNKLVKDSIKTRSTHFEGGTNDQRWNDMNDNLSIGNGDNHSDQDSSSRRNVEEFSVPNLTRLLKEQKHMNQ
jgi:hypothetical protein